jgi:hypothetical protein
MFWYKKETQVSDTTRVDKEISGKHRKLQEAAGLKSARSRSERNKNGILK